MNLGFLSLCELYLVSEIWTLLKAIGVGFFFFLSMRWWYNVQGLFQAQDGLLGCVSFSSGCAVDWYI